MIKKKLLARLALIPVIISLTACSQTGSPGEQAILPTTAQSKPALDSAIATVTKAALTPTGVATSTSPSASAPAGLQQVTGRYLFTEGPATDSEGNVFFSDVNGGKIYKWSPDGSVKIFLEGLNRPNGLAFTAQGLLIACESGNGRLISIDAQGQISVLVDQYNQKRFNEPNDLWIDARGGIYFTDPVYQSTLAQAGEDVYYISPDLSQVTRIISDLVRPNGIVGTPDGKTLYVADHGAGKIFAYDIQSGGVLANKRQFAPTGSDGMELDRNGNLYLTTPNKVQIFDQTGKHLRDIQTDENPTNVTFCGADRLTLLITARTAVYTIQLGEDF